MPGAAQRGEFRRARRGELGLIGPPITPTIPNWDGGVERVWSKAVLHPVYEVKEPSLNFIYWFLSVNAWKNGETYQEYMDSTIGKIHRRNGDCDFGFGGWESDGIITNSSCNLPRLGAFLARFIHGNTGSRVFTFFFLALLPTAKVFGLAIEDLTLFIRILVRSISELISGVSGWVLPGILQH
ncbi:hypothetical protein C8R44DRAFT_738849 [Mycena epipterygia]|nr:hypothetical protein C8R44DRAFT_738849 [Mycena epipterygia]